MLQPDPRLAARDRDAGLRKIGRLTRRAGLAGAAGTAVIALAFGQHGISTSGSGSSKTSTPHEHAQGSIVIPAQPPKSSSGSGLVTSGGS